MTEPHIFSVDSDLHSASTPAAALYTDPGLQERLRERVLARSWQWVGEAASVGGCDQVHPLELLPGSLSEPLLLTRDGGGELRLLSNVCTHRAALVCQEPGARKELRCRYHGRRFGLDGRLLHAPEFEDARDFPTERDDLPGIPCERFGPLLFGSLDPLCSFAEWLGPMGPRLAWLPWERAGLVEEGTQDYEVEAHWALYCENYLEGFHIPYVHPSLTRVLDWQAYDIECFEWGSVQVAHAAEGELAFEAPEGSPDHGRRVGAFYIWLFPNTMLNVYPWGLSLNVVEPRGSEACRVRFRRYVWDDSLLEQGAGSGLDQVELEDEEVVQSVQRGIRSRLYRRGRYAPRHEGGVWHFHRLLEKTLGS